MARRDYLTAALTGKGQAVDAEKAHELNVLALTRRIHNARRRLRHLQAEEKRIKQQLKADRRELRAVLQRSATVTDAQLELAGRADGADRAIALAAHQVPTLTVSEGAQELITQIADDLAAARTEEK